MDVELHGGRHLQPERARHAACRAIPSPWPPTPPGSARTRPPGTASLLDDLSDISRENVFINVPSVIINLVKSERQRLDPGPAPAADHRGREGVTTSGRPGAHSGDLASTPATQSAATWSRSRRSSTRTSESRSMSSRVSTTIGRSPSNSTVEVSQLGDTVPVGPDQEAVTIGTRTITSVIRLKSGESSLLAGLIRKDSQEGRTETPLLSDIPWLGRLFTNEEEAIEDHRSRADPDPAHHPLPGHRRGGSGADLGGHRKPHFVLWIALASSSVGYGSAGSIRPGRVQERERRNAASERRRRRISLWSSRQVRGTPRVTVGWFRGWCRADSEGRQFRRRRGRP